MQHVKGTHFDLDLPYLLALWLICAVWATVVVSQRRHPIWKGLLLGLALGPVGLLWALTMSAVPVQDRRETGVVACSFCGHPVGHQVLVCPHCGRQWPTGHRDG